MMLRMLSERWKRRCLWIAGHLVWIGGAAGMAILALLLYFYPGVEGFKVTSLVAGSATPGGKPVEVEARLDRNLFEGSGSGAQLQVSVANSPGGVELSQVLVYIEAPGFVVDQNPCVWVPAAKGGARLPAGQRITCTMPLRSAQGSGTGEISIFADWVRGMPEEVSLKLGPVKFEGMFGAERWNRFGRRVAETFKDLALPLLILGGGAWLNKRQNDREAERQKLEKIAERRRQKAENRRAAQRVKEEKRLADRQQVRLLLLEKVMDLAEHHYLPIVSQIRLILSEAGMIRRREADCSEDRLFYRLLLLLKRMDELRQKKGGVFFQKRDGEYIAHDGWMIMRSALYGVLGSDLIASALSQVELEWEYDAFLAKKRVLLGLRARFSRWLIEPAPAPASSSGSAAAARFGSFFEYLGVLDVVQAVFLFEADRALSEGWYEEEASIRLQLPGVPQIPVGARLPPDQVALAGTLKSRSESFYQLTIELKELT